jgi:hypothetical protein
MRGRRLIQNGYLPQKITVLTPYVGQAKKMRRTFESNKLTVVMGDKDLQELQRAEADPFVSLENTAGDENAHGDAGSGSDQVINDARRSRMSK